MALFYTGSQSISDGSALKQSHQSETGYKYMIWHWWKIVLRTGVSLFLHLRTTGNLPLRIPSLLRHSRSLAYSTSKRYFTCLLRHLAYFVTQDYLGHRLHLRISPAKDIRFACVLHPIFFSCIHRKPRILSLPSPSFTYCTIQVILGPCAFTCVLLPSHSLV